MARFSLLSDICGLHVVGSPPRREDGSVIHSYNFLSHSDPSPAELMTASYCLIWDSPNMEGQVPVVIPPKSKATLRPTIRRPSRTRNQFFFLLEILFRQFQVCDFVAHSLTRGRVCNLLLLLVLAREVPLGSALSDERSGLYQSRHAYNISIRTAQKTHLQICKYYKILYIYV
jgi:hypothetical protein